jgi:hypothetical protein
MASFSSGCQSSGAQSRIVACGRSNGISRPDESYLEEGIRILELARNAQRSPTRAA